MRNLCQRIDRSWPPLNERCALAWGVLGFYTGAAGRGGAYSRLQRHMLPALLSCKHHSHLRLQRGEASGLSAQSIGASRDLILVLADRK